MQCHPGSRNAGPAAHRAKDLNQIAVGQVDRVSIDAGTIQSKFAFGLGANGNRRITRNNIERCTSTIKYFASYIYTITDKTHVIKRQLEVRHAGGLYYQHSLLARMTSLSVTSSSRMMPASLPLMTLLLIVLLPTISTPARELLLKVLLLIVMLALAVQAPIPCCH